jgi:hypothetical protein
VHLTDKAANMAARGLMLQCAGGKKDPPNAAANSTKPGLHCPHTHTQVKLSHRSRGCIRTYRPVDICQQTTAPSTVCGLCV